MCVRASAHEMAFGNESPMAKKMAARKLFDEAEEAVSDKIDSLIQDSPDNMTGTLTDVVSSAHDMATIIKKRLRDINAHTRNETRRITTCQEQQVLAPDRCSQRNVESPCTPTLPAYIIHHII